MSLISNVFVPYQYWNGKDPAGRLPSPRHVGRGQPRFFDYLTDAWEYYLNNPGGGGGGNVQSIVAGYGISVNSGNVAAPVVGFNMSGDGTRYNIPYQNSLYMSATDKLQFNPLTSTLSVPALNLTTIGAPLGALNRIFISSFTASTIRDQASSTGLPGQVMTDKVVGSITEWGGPLFSTFILTDAGTNPVEIFGDTLNTFQYNFPWAGITSNSVIVGSATQFIGGANPSSDFFPLLVVGPDILGSNGSINIIMTNSASGDPSKKVEFAVTVIKY
jgi:hypothetical protein